MIRVVVSILLLLFSVTSIFAQNRKFEKFIKDMETYESENKSVQLIKDTTIDLKNYDLKWVKLTGSYGGSPYCCEGKAIKIDSLNLRDYATEQLVLEKSLDIPDLYDFIESTSIKTIGHNYIVYYSWYPEPQPTSNPHYVQLISYYEIKEN